MKSIELMVVVGLLAVLAGCGVQQLTRSAETANALLALRSDYDAARQALADELGRLPPDTAAELQVLAERADRLVATVSSAWVSKDPLALSLVREWVAEGEDIYERGRAVIRPHLDELSPPVRARVEQLERDVQRVRAGLKALEAQQPNYDEYARAVIEIVTLALRIAAEVM